MTIKLDADLFMALGLSAEAHGGIGSVVAFDDAAPCCIVGHAEWLDGLERIVPVTDATPTERWIWESLPWTNHPRALLTDLNDQALIRRVGIGRRVPFARWCELVGVEVAE